MSNQLSKTFCIRLSFQEERDRLRETLVEIEDISKVEGIADTLELVIGELANNAIKSNIKRIFFEAKGYSFETEEDYEAGLKAFNTNFSHLNFTHYQKAMSLLDMKVEINVNLNEKYLVIELCNKNTMSEIEEKYLRNKLKLVMKKMPSDMLDLYVHYGDEIASDGLGLTIIIDLIRNLGFDPKSFTVYNEEKHTKARLEFPLDTKYLTR